MRSVHVAVLVVASACWRDAAPDKPVQQRPPGMFAISQTAFGPLDAHSIATLVPLRQTFAGYDVRPLNDEDTLEYAVYSGAEMLLYVVPDDDGAVFNVHATSPKVTVVDRDWRVGAPFQGAAHLTTCECWGDNPTCWKTGDHVAVSFARECGELTHGDRRVLRVLDGVAVQRLIWSPKPFGAAASPPE